MGACESPTCDSHVGDMYRYIMSICIDMYRYNNTSIHCIYIHTHTHTHTHTCIYIYIKVKYMYLIMHIYIYIYVYTYIYTCIYLCLYTYIIHIYTGTIICVSCLYVYVDIYIQKRICPLYKKKYICIHIMYKKKYIRIHIIRYSISNTSVYYA